MALKISGASIRHPIPALVLFAVLLVLGVVAFRAIPITRAPNVDVPIVSVTVTESGAAPAELETQVTRKVEDAIASVSGVKHITSSVTDGASTTLVELRLEVSTDRALNDVKDAVAKIREDLPRTIDEPIIERIDVVGQAIQTFAAAAPGMTAEQLSWFIDDTVIRELQGVPGVGRVDRIGGVTRAWRPWASPPGRSMPSCVRPMSSWQAAAARWGARSRPSAPWPTHPASPPWRTPTSCSRMAARSACPTSPR